MSELELLDRIARTSVRRAGTVLGVGDDAAVLEGAPAIVVTTDLLVEDVHFRRAHCTLRDIGHKAVAVSLSDLAAMGAAPRALFVGLAAPAGALDTAGHDELRAGMDALAAAHGATIAGGDLTRGPALMLAVTAVGTLDDPSDAVTRAGAHPGDVLAVTGPLGGAVAGRALADDPDLAGRVPDAAALRAADSRPQPRVSAGRRLATAGAHAMLDCSDGLLLDADRLARASGVRVVVDLDAVPLAAGVAAVADALGREADLMAATGGEDFELIVALDEGGLARARAAGVGLHVVGSIEAGADGLRLRRHVRPVAPPRELGWAHDV